MGPNYPLISQLRCLNRSSDDCQIDIERIGLASVTCPYSLGLCLITYLFDFTGSGCVWDPATGGFLGCAAGPGVPFDDGQIDFQLRGSAATIGCLSHLHGPQKCAAARRMLQVMFLYYYVF